MRITNSSVKAAQHGSQFFHKFPTAADEIEKEIKTRGIAGIFHYAAEQFPKEISEHQAADTQVRTTKGNIRELSAILRKAAHDLCDAANLILSMLGHDEIEINFARTKNDIADYENLIAQIQQHAQLILQDNATIKNTFEKFIADLARYKKDLGSIGEAIAQEKKEDLDVENISRRLHPILSGLTNLLGRYFRLKDAQLYDEWRVKKSVKAKGENVAGKWVVVSLNWGFHFLSCDGNVWGCEKCSKFVAMRFATEDIRCLQTFYLFMG